MSNEEIEKSESGDPIYRHKERLREWTVPNHAAENLEEVEAHVERYIGKIETVFHELVSDFIHLDVLLIPATDQRPYHVLVTSGVSEEPMTVPAGSEKFRRAELLMALPRDWPLTEEAFKNENNYWPLRWLKLVGRLPHEYKKWIGWGHTIPHGDPPEPIANSRFVGVMVTPPYWLPPEFFQLKSKSGDEISFYHLVPLYAEEMDLKLKNGADELEQRFEKANTDFILDLERGNVAKRRGWFR